MTLELTVNDCLSHLTDWVAGDLLPADTSMEILYTSGSNVFSTDSYAPLSDSSTYFETRVLTIHSPSQITHTIVIETIVKNWKSEWMVYDSSNPWGFFRIKYTHADTGEIGVHEILHMDCRKLLWFSGITDTTPINYWFDHPLTIGPVILDFAAPDALSSDIQAWVTTCM